MKARRRKKLRYEGRIMTRFRMQRRLTTYWSETLKARIFSNFWGQVLPKTDTWPDGMGDTISRI